MPNSCLSGLGESECAWIGAASWNTAREYRWISVPNDPDDPDATGILLTNTYSNFPAGIYPFVFLFFFLHFSSFFFSKERFTVDICTCFLFVLIITGVPTTSSHNGACIKRDGTWQDVPHNTKQKILCGWTRE